MQASGHFLYLTGITFKRHFETFPTRLKFLAATCTKTTLTGVVENSPQRYSRGFLSPEMIVFAFCKHKTCSGT